MHIPDGFLSANVYLPAWLISVWGIGYCLKRAARTLKDRMVPLMGVTAAFVFASQMLNFPVFAGTSGHLLGAALSVVLLGPWVAAIVITVVLTVQSLIFQDGGLIALGANIFNMSILGVVSGYLFYRTAIKIIKGNRGVVLGVAAASWVSVVITSVACSLELAASGVFSLKAVLPAMLSVYAFIGIGEAVATSLVIGFVLKVRPDLVYCGS